MAQTSINIRMDSELKNAFEDFCKDVGMTMTTAICVFAKKVVKENRIPFEINGYEPNEKTLKALEEVEDMKKNPSKYKSYTDVDEMMKDILS